MPSGFDRYSQRSPCTAKAACPIATRPVWTSETTASNAIKIYLMVDTYLTQTATSVGDLWAGRASGAQPPGSASRERVGVYPPFSFAIPANRYFFAESLCPEASSALGVLSA